MRRTVIALVGLFVLTTSRTVGGFGEEESLTADRIASAVKIDGVLDEGCWEGVAWRCGFRRLDDLDERASGDTRFALMCDDEFLYLGAEMSEREPAKLVALAGTRDGDVYRDDCIQFFLDPVRDDGDYFSFTVNGLGTLRDTKNLRVGWNSDARAAARKSALSWTVELAIPLGDLELTPESVQEPWGANVARARRAGSRPELSTYAPVRGTFHQPGRFAPLDVPVESLGPYVWRLSPPFEKKVEPVEGKPVFQARVLAENCTGRFRFFVVEAELCGESVRAKGEPIRDGLDDGDKHFIEIRTPTAGLGEATLVVSLYDALEPGRLLARRRDRVDASYSPITPTLTAPWYKNTIFASQPTDRVVVSVRSDLPAESLGRFTLVADIRSGEKILAGPVRVEPVLRETAVSIPAAELPEGDFCVRVALADGEGRAIHKATTRLRKLARQEGEVSFDRNMACLVDGRPFLPFGWFGVRAEAFEEFAAEGYNTVGAYLPTGTSLGDDEVKQYLDKAHSLGLKVICRPQPSAAVLRSGENLLTEEEAEAMRALVRKWRGHPAVLAWYMCDEPEGKGQPFQRRLEEYRVVDEEDPYHPAIVLNNTVPGIHKYHPAGDLLMPDVYPGFLRAGGASRIARPIQAMLACGEATGGRKPVWITPQGHVQTVEGHRGPTFRELRNQAWQGAAGGATGFFWYREVFLTNLVHSKIGAPCVQRELEAILPAVRTRSVEEMARADAGPEDLCLAGKRVDGQLYVIAVSLSTSKMEVAFEVDGLGDRPLLVLSENRRIQPTGGAFGDRFEPYEAHVYTTDLSLPQLPAVAEIEARIEEEIRARGKPGNLAYQATGAEVFCQHHGGQAVFLNDGSTSGVYWPREYGKPSHPLPNWVEVRFPEPRRIGRVVVYSGRGPQQPATLRDGKVQTFENGSWTTVAEIVGNEQDPATITFPARATDGLRLVITASNGSRIAIQEIEAYAR
ncbi:hypothetical protein ACFL5Q_03970 [Planctomycetota bacterium]